MSDWVGKRYVDDRKAERHEDDYNIVKHSDLPEGTRVLHPDSMWTMDYNPDRVNVHVDDDCIITKVRNG